MKKYYFSDPPLFITMPSSVEADKKEAVDLTCDVDGNPLDIVWVHDPIDRVSTYLKLILYVVLST